MALSWSVCLAQTPVIEGKVTFADGTVPKLAHVSLRSADGVVAKLTEVDSSGRYVFTDIPPGTYFMNFFGANIEEDRAGKLFRDDVVVGSGASRRVVVDVVLEEPQ